MAGPDEAARIEAEGLGDPSQSVMDELAASSEEQAERRIKITIPGWSGRLIAVYKAMEWEEVERLAKKFKKDTAPGHTLRGAQDHLIAACEEILIIQGALDSDPVPLHEAIPDFGPEPVRYDQRLAQATKKDVGEKASARAVIAAVFPNDESVMAHHRAYENKVSFVDEQDAEDF